MEKNLVRKAGERGQDNLIAGLHPPAMTTAVKLAAGSGVLPRGTVLAYSDTDVCQPMAAGRVPAYILAKDADASGAEAVPAVVYRSGCFNPQAVTVPEGYELTAGDKKELRRFNIIFRQMLED